MRDERLSHGVKRRMDGMGDGWANAHRGLGREYYMNDVDALFGIEMYGHNTGNRLFAEYEPDTYLHRQDVIREYALVALFDRKATLAAAWRPQNRPSLGFYLYLCRVSACAQPLPPRFFLCLGEHEPPWTLYEIDIWTGTHCGKEEVLETADRATFEQVWDHLGLTELRTQLRSWINPPEQQKQRTLFLSKQNEEPALFGRCMVCVKTVPIAVMHAGRCKMCQR
jgi:hypothetical protein